MHVSIRCRVVYWWLAVAAIALAGGPPAQANTLPQPTGAVLLTIAGAVTNTNRDGRADFDRAMLEAMPSTVIETSTPWTDGVNRFEGVLLRDLLARVGAAGATVRAVALNDYFHELPVADFERYDVILAYRMNGRRLRIRDKGPLWIVYPLDVHTELRDLQARLKMVWQLRRLIVQ